jgi:hypothetical protein
VITILRQLCAILAASALLAACAKPAPPPIVDVRPIGQGLEFVGIALVLAVLIFVFSRFLGK